MYAPTLSQGQRHFSKHRPDLRSRGSMAQWLAAHYRYDTMSSVNGVTSYANCVKLHRLGLTREQDDAAYTFLSAPAAFSFIEDRIMEFTDALHGQYTVGLNGRSNGYLVLYGSCYEPSAHKSVCTECGQRNFREVFSREGLEPTELAVAELVLSRQTLYTVQMVQADPAVQALGLSDAQGQALARKWLENRKHGSFDTKCGRCHEEARVPYSGKELRVWPGRGIDQGMAAQDFSEDNDWSMSRLQERVRLVHAFDELCDVIRADFLELLSTSRVVTKTIFVPQQVQVVEPLEA